MNDTPKPRTAVIAVRGYGSVTVSILGDPDEPHRRYVTASVAGETVHADAIALCGNYRLGHWHMGMTRVSMPELTDAVHDLLNGDGRGGS